MTARQALTVYGNQQAVKILKLIPKNMSIIEAEKSELITTQQADILTMAISHLPKHARDNVAKSAAHEVAYA